MVRRNRGKHRAIRHRRKMPRIVVFALTLGMIGLITSVALALVSDSGTYDLTVPNKNTSTGLISLGNASAEYIGSAADNQASGTGLFDPFVRLQGSPTEKGYNTDGAVDFDTKTGTWTHAIKVNAIPIVDCDGDGTGTATCWELFVDINDSNNAKRISLNEVEIWFTTDPNLVGYVDPSGFPAGATQEYDFSGDILINDVNQGSGRGDLRYLVPTAGHTWDADTYFVLYSKWGTTAGTTGNFGTGGYSSEGGFEEWKVRKTPNVSIVKTEDAASVNAGSDIGFTITVTNSGVADATGVTISDSLPGGTGTTPVHWTESPDNPNCTISGSDGSQSLSCGPVTLAAGGGSLSVHLSASTTADNCGQYDNTATFTSDNAGTGSDDAAVTVNCAAIVIHKDSTKGGAVANAGAVFSVEGPDPSTTSFNVTDDETAGAPDEDADAGEVCVSGLAPGTYTVNEVTPPSGYGSASEFDLSVEAVQGTNCTTSLPTGTGIVTFTNAPLYDLQVNFRDGGSGETSATSITCTTTDGVGDSTPATGWDASNTFEDELLSSNPETITCVIVVDP